MITELNKNNFKEYISSGLKLVEFYAPWCGFCKKQRPVLEQMNKIQIGMINSEYEPEIFRKYGVNSFPTFLVFKNGKELERFLGMRSKFDLMDVLLRHMK